MDSMEITYLDNSGFVVKIGNTALLFDYYRDENHCLSSVLADCNKVYIFSSHVHHDHFNPKIVEMADSVAKYFLSFDIKPAAKSLLSSEKVIYLNPYETVKEMDIKVSSYGSTDEGISFYVEFEGWRIFHAGDLNWWHWDGDTETNNKFARNRFAKEMKHLTGLVSDVAFFPIDSRLGEYCALGVKEFCDHTMVRQLIAMHTQGIAWHPPEGFFAKEKEMKYWCPTKNGSKLSIEKGELSCKENG
ncbi:MBL fold metallo-hydrolase [Anaerosinus gibii]|uniref:MBL fold metallo-hydrolase n=1 Tax=Selenobaculum gibii TaxID=3054208 RepID=A0A9Y2AJI1_9FIRM|nr:MBL fold metallo-hydrolase [Selenobaculum gbiensis]WIW71216.1 MBL fold metallo-hydrolase [Selenobaculum gbiensis]